MAKPFFKAPYELRARNLFFGKISKCDIGRLASDLRPYLVLTLFTIDNIIFPVNVILGVHYGRLKGESVL